MPTNISPDFSVYELIERIQAQSTVMNHRRTMSVISHQIEDATLTDGAHTRIFSAFQKLSRFLPQVKRYTKLAQQAESIYVFGIPDITPPSIPNINYVYLKPTDRLAKEWFLISFGRDYASALATEELTHIDDPDDQRMFKGIWTFDVRMTAILEEWLSHSIDAPELLIKEEDVNCSHQRYLVNNIMNRLSHKLDRYEPEMRQELHNIMETSVYPALVQ